MIIIIKSPPYGTESGLGSLFIALSTAEQNIPTKVIFVDQGLYNILPDQNSENLLDIPPISDIIMQFVGLVNFYAIPKDSNSEENQQKGEEEIFSIDWMKKKGNMLPGIKIINYAQLVEFLEQQPKNVLTF
ncbi:MAG: DsrE family protein [Promethearchaeota archaeon]